MLHIRFPNEKAAEDGFYELITHGHVKGLPGDVFEVSRRQLAVLDQAHIPYEILTQEKPVHADATLRDSLATGV
jgi:hypothetical protein